MKETCTSVMAIYDIPRRDNCIIGFDGIQASGVWKNNTNFLNTQKTRPRASLPPTQTLDTKGSKIQGVGSLNHRQSRGP